MAGEQRDSAGQAIGTLVYQMVSALVEDPQLVRVSHALREECVVVNVAVAESDLGKLIGKQGRTARSLRTIVGAASMRYKVRCDLNIEE